LFIFRLYLAKTVAGFSAKPKKLSQP